MNFRSSTTRTLALSILSLAAMGPVGAAYADQHANGGGGHAASGGGGGGGGHSAPHGGGGGGGGFHGGHGGAGPATRGGVGYRGPSPVQRGFSARPSAPSGRGWTGSGAGHSNASGAYPGHTFVNHRAYTAVYGRGGWGHAGGWYPHYPYWTYVGGLPWYASTLWWGGVPYYYADNTYFLWNDTAAQYQVVPPPPNAGDETGAPAPAAAPELYVYPNAGQSAEQQATDRYECHRWAVDQTGFDPTRADGGVAPDAVADAASAYRRAEGACLQGRGYTVR